MVVSRVLVCLPVRHTPVFYLNGRTDWAHFWHRGYIPSAYILCCVERELGYLQNKGLPF